MNNFTNYAIFKWFIHKEEDVINILIIIYHIYLPTNIYQLIKIQIIRVYFVYAFRIMYLIYPSTLHPCILYIYT